MRKNWSTRLKRARIREVNGIAFAGRKEGDMKNFESLFAAYLLVWGILFVYHLTVGARVAKLQREIERLKELHKQ